MEKVLIIGGTGTMGAPLVDQLYEKGYDISVVCRKHRNDNRSTIKYYYGDAKSLVFLQNLLRQRFDVVVDFCVYKSSEFRRNIQVLLDATSQYVCLSSAAVYADKEEPKTEESARYMETDKPIDGDRKFNWYCYEKARIEDILKETNRKNWTIIRPGITVNKNHIGWGINWGNDWFLRVMQGKRVVVPQEMLPYKTSVTHGGYVAKMLMAIIGNPKALGETYNVTSTEEFTWQELLDIYKNIFSKHGYTLQIKYVKSSEMVSRDQIYKEVYYRARLLDRRFDSSKIQRLMQDTSFVPLASLLDAWTAEIVKGSNKTPKSEIAHTAQVDILTGDIAPKEYFETSLSYFKYCFARHMPFIFSCLMFVKRCISKLFKIMGIK